MSILIVAAIAGCSETALEYQGVTPTMRTMQDSPGLSDYYYGGDLRFAITEPATSGPDGKLTRPGPPPKIDPDDQPKPLPPPPIP
jgi:hypothetical protein